jgi:hypothetical protein
MALVTTFATTPLTAALYPPWYQTKLEAWKRGEIDWDTGRPIGDNESSNRDSLAFEKMEKNRIQKMLVYLRLDSMPPILAFMATLGGNTPSAAARLHPKHEATGKSEDSETSVVPVKPIGAHGVRLIELSDRESSVMQVSEVDEFSNLDPLVNTFRTFGTMHNFAVSGDVAILPEYRFADVLATKAENVDADLLVLPWTETGSMNEAQPISSQGLKDKISSSSYISFVSDTLQQASCNTAVFINKNFGGAAATHKASGRPGFFRTKSVQSMSSAKHDDVAAPVRDRSHHIFCPFFGGADDRYALRIVLQLAENPDVTATIVHFEADSTYFEDIEVMETSTTLTPARSQTAHSGKPATTVTSLASPPGERDHTFFLSIKNSIPADLAGRVFFESVNAGSTPLKSTLSRAAEEVGQRPQNAGDLIVLGRNAARLGAFTKEAARTGTEAKKCLGVVGNELINASLRASVVVVQASPLSAE